MMSFDKVVYVVNCMGKIYAALFGGGRFFSFLGANIK